MSDNKKPLPESSAFSNPNSSYRRNPRPVKDPTGASVEAVWNDNYLKYGQLFGTESSQTVAMLMTALQRANTSQRRQTVADAGCGGGRDSIGLAIKGFDAIGIDVSRQGLVLARQNYEEVQGKFSLVGSVHFFHCDMETTFHNYVGSLDGISSHRTFHLMVKAQKKLFAECAAELVQPGGFIAIGARCEKDFKPDQMVWVKNKKGRSARYNKKVCRQDPGRVGHVLNFVTENELTKLFSKNFDIQPFVYGEELERVTEPNKGKTQLIFMLAQRKMAPQPA